jgi:hypothetical protein
MPTPPIPNVRNLPAIRSGQATPAQFYEAFADMQQAIANLSQQVNGNPNAPVPAPPQISSITPVAIGSGFVDVAIVDNNPVTRGIEYFCEYSTDQNFLPATTKTFPMGPSKNARIPVGSGNVFLRGYSAYSTSSPSSPVFASGPVDAGGGFLATAGNPGAGSGTETNVNPRTGAGFGFVPNRPQNKGA